jgi:hypothetical protein
MTEPLAVLARSRALWNFARLDLANDEVVAQILDRGSLEDWRALYALMRRDGGEAAALRRRVIEILFRVPIGHPFFWLAALDSLGEPLDPSRRPRIDDGLADV